MGDEGEMEAYLQMCFLDSVRGVIRRERAIPDGCQIPQDVEDEVDHVLVALRAVSVCLRARSSLNVSLVAQRAAHDAATGRRLA